MLTRNVIALVAFLVLSLGTGNARELSVLSGIGGNFSAVNTDGVEMQFSQFQNQVVLLAFGYTNCADICPFTLGYLKKIYRSLTPEQRNQTQVVFVTVDPEYDTPEHLKAYMAHFSSDFVGITGSKKQIDRIVSLYQTEYKTLSDTRLPTHHMRRPVHKHGADAHHETSKLYSHSVQVFLIDKHGRTRGVAFTGTPKAQLIADIRRLVNEP